jgi:hypothetical protein
MIVNPNPNDPNSWWHQQIVLPDVEVETTLVHDLVFVVENGRKMLVDSEGNDRSENVILTFPDGAVMKASDYFKLS